MPPLSKEEFMALPPEQQNALASGSSESSAPLSKEEFMKLPEEKQLALANGASHEEEPAPGFLSEFVNAMSKRLPAPTHRENDSAPIESLSPSQIRERLLNPTTKEDVALSAADPDSMERMLGNSPAGKFRTNMMITGLIGAAPAGLAADAGAGLLETPAMRTVGGRAAEATGAILRKIGLSHKVSEKIKELIPIAATGKYLYSSIFGGDEH